jgi:TRAP-type C4-dicarboxylate transport system permease small subunit
MPPPAPPGGTPQQPPAGAPVGPPVQPSRGGTAGRRIAALVAALVFLFAGAVMIIASLDLADGPLCSDVASGEALPEDGECFDVSSTMQTVKTVLTAASGIAAAVVVLAGLFCLFTGRGGRIVVVAAGTAIVLGAVGILI